MQSDVALTVANTAWQFSPASDAVLESAKFPFSPASSPSPIPPAISST